MTRHARWAVLLALATALGEAALQAMMMPHRFTGGPMALFFAFLVGPPLFLALLAWRRKEHPGRSRLLLAVALLIAVGGLGYLGFNLYRFNTDPDFRRELGVSAFVVPLAQWAVVMAVWLWLVFREGRESAAAAKAAQAAQAAGNQNAPNPPQSA